MQIQKLDHFTIIVSDLQATRGFYEGLLGMTVLPRPDFNFEGMWFGREALNIHAILENELTGKSGVVHREGGRLSRHQHFAFQVEDFEAAVQQVQATEVTIFDGPKSRPDGIQQLFISDPDGHVIELCE